MARHYYGVINRTNRMMLCTRYRSRDQHWHDTSDTDHYGWQVSLWTSREQVGDFISEDFIKNFQDPSSESCLYEIVHFKVM